MAQRLSYPSCSARRAASTIACGLISAPRWGSTTPIFMALCLLGAVQQRIQRRAKRGKLPAAIRARQHPDPASTVQSARGAVDEIFQRDDVRVGARVVLHAALGRVVAALGHG